MAWKRPSRRTPLSTRREVAPCTCRSGPRSAPREHPASAGSLQFREVAVGVAVVLERLLEHDVDALLYGVLAVLEDVNHLREVRWRHRLEVVVHTLGPVGAHLQRFLEARLRAAVAAGPVEAVGPGVRKDDRMERPAEDRDGEPLVDGHDDVAQRLDERPLAVDRLMQLLLG